MKNRIDIARVGVELTTIENLTQWRQTQGEEELFTSLLILGNEVEEGDLYKLDIIASKFERCRFLHCDFEKASFVDVIFENCDFSNSRFAGAYFSRCEFRNCKCLGTDFHEAVLKQVQMSDSVLRYGNFGGTLLENVFMEQCDFMEASFSNMKHKKWNANKCQFIGTNFFRTFLRGFDFSENEMADIIVSDTMEELKGCKISPMQALEAAKLLDMQVV